MGGGDLGGGAFGDTAAFGDAGALPIVGRLGSGVAGALAVAAGAGSGEGGGAVVLLATGPGTGGWATNKPVHNGHLATFPTAEGGSCRGRWQRPQGIMNVPIPMPSTGGVLIGAGGLITGGRGVVGPAAGLVAVEVGRGVAGAAGVFLARTRKIAGHSGHLIRCPSNWRGTRIKRLQRRQRATKTSGFFPASWVGGGAGLCDVIRAAVCLATKILLQ